MKLNIGAGWSRFDGYLNCDISPEANPDFVFDLEKDIWPFEDNTVDAVIAHHILEHLGDGYFHALKELYRVCKPDAIVDIWVPHYAHHNFFHDPTHRRSITPFGLDLFNKFNNYNSPSAASKLGLIFDIDLRVVDYEAIVDCRYQYLQQYPVAAIEEMAFEKKNLIEEYRIKVKVVKWSSNHYRIYKYYLEVLGRPCNPDEADQYMDLTCSDEEFKLKLMNSEEYKQQHHQQDQKQL